MHGLAQRCAKLFIRRKNAPGSNEPPEVFKEARLFIVHSSALSFPVILSYFLRSQATLAQNGDSCGVLLQQSQARTPRRPARQPATLKHARQIISASNASTSKSAMAQQAVLHRLQLAYRPPRASIGLPGAV